MTCAGCRHHLGMGLCRINLEAECAGAQRLNFQIQPLRSAEQTWNPPGDSNLGGGYEAWEPREVRTYTAEEFLEASEGGWGGKKEARDYMAAYPKEVYTTDDLFALRRFSGSDGGEHRTGRRMTGGRTSKRYGRD